MLKLLVAGGGGKLLPIHSLKWNPNDVLTNCPAISAADRKARRLSVPDCQRFWERKKKTRGSKAGRSRYFILATRKIFILCRFSDSGFLFLLNNFRVQSLEYTAYSKRCVLLIGIQWNRRRVELSAFCRKPKESWGRFKVQSFQK